MCVGGDIPGRAGQWNRRPEKKLSASLRLPSVLPPSLIMSADSCVFTPLRPSVHPLDGGSGKTCFLFCVVFLPCLLTALLPSQPPHPRPTPRTPPGRIPCQGQVQMARPRRRPRVRLRYPRLNLFQDSARKS